MSLLTNFQTKQKLISTAATWSEFILNHEQAMENQNCWQCRYYNITSSSAPTLSTISGLTPTKTMIKADFNSYSDWSWGNNYVGYMQCYVKCNKDYTLSTTFYTDDGGRVYLNGASRATSSSCQNTSVSLPFKEGWNKVIIMFQEGSGADGAALLTKLSTQSFVDVMYANKYNDITEL